MHCERTQLLMLCEEMRSQTWQKRLEPFGYSVVVKSTLFDGLIAIDKLHPDLIIVGSHLADATIYDVCRQIRQIQYYMPLLIVVEDGDDYDRVLALEIGADDYIAGAVTMRELVARIRAQLRRAYVYSNVDSDVLKIGNLLLDCARGQAYMGQRALNLTPIEFRLLKILIQHRDRILSRSQILNQVWGYDLRSCGEEIVKVNICRLRRKVENDPLNPKLILTVRGLGYRLATDNTSRY